METAIKANLTRYYRFHAKIYDATRWSFLFGRNQLMSAAADRFGGVDAPRRILEVGCGTGKNLVGLSRMYPSAEITGLDLSPHMLVRAGKRLAGEPEDRARNVRLKLKLYNDTFQPDHPYDLIVFSYTLSMINPGWTAVIEKAAIDLAPGGRVAVVDFHDSRVGAFKRWMGVNHVRMESHLLPEIRKFFTPVFEKTPAAYGGLWEYFLFIGGKKPQGAENPASI